MAVADLPEGQAVLLTVTAEASPAGTRATFAIILEGALAC